MLGVGGWGKIGAFYGRSKDGEHLNPFFMSVGAPTSKSTVVVLLGRGAQSHSSLLPLRFTKKGRIWEEAQLRFVGNPSFYNLIGSNPFDLIAVNEFDVLFPAQPFHETLCSLSLVTSNFPQQSSFQAGFSVQNLSLTPPSSFLFLSISSKPSKYIFCINIP